jgi:hypothetical protein
LSRPRDHEPKRQRDRDDDVGSAGSTPLEDPLAQSLDRADGPERAALGSSRRPVGIDRARIDRQMREVALQHVAGGLDDASYLARLNELRAQLKTLDDHASAGVPPDRAVAWLRILGETWRHADEPEAKADLLHAIYARITVAGPSIVSARLTPSAEAHGLALALPQVVMARPTGVRRAHAHLGFRQILIEGADEWRSAALESA